MNKAYKPTVWADGDTITADKLNKMELGIHDMYENSEPLIVTFRNGIGDKSADDVINAFENGRTVLFDFDSFKICTLRGIFFSLDGIRFDFNNKCYYEINVSNNRLTCVYNELQ